MKEFNEQMWDNWVDTRKKKVKPLLSSLKQNPDGAMIWQSQYISLVHLLTIIQYSSPILKYLKFPPHPHSQLMTLLPISLAKQKHSKESFPCFLSMHLPPTIYVAFPPLSNGLCLLLGQLLHWCTRSQFLSHMQVHPSSDLHFLPGLYWIISNSLQKCCYFQLFVVSIQKYC